MKDFICVMKAGDYQLMISVPGENQDDSASWVLTGDGWLYIEEDTYLEDTLFTFEEDSVYELPSDGLGW